jgi:hypothetical protein
VLSQGTAGMTRDEMVDFLCVTLAGMNERLLVVEAAMATEATALAAKTAAEAAQTQTTAADIQEAVGLEEANLDAQLSGLATTTSQTSILTAINAITTNTARSMPVVPSSLLKPSTGSTTYQVMLYLYNLQGNLEDADTQTITIHARTADGTSLDANLSATTMTRQSVGKYSTNYTLTSSATYTAIYFDFTWSIDSVSMADSGASAIERVDSDTEIVTIAEGIVALQESVSNIPTDGDKFTKPFSAEVLANVPTATTVSITTEQVNVTSES